MYGQDNVFIISNFKSKYPVLQLDLRYSNKFVRIFPISSFWVLDNTDRVILQAHIRSCCRHCVCNLWWNCFCLCWTTCLIFDLGSSVYAHSTNLFSDSKKPFAGAYWVLISRITCWTWRSKCYQWNGASMSLLPVKCVSLHFRRLCIVGWLLLQSCYYGTHTRVCSQISIEIDGFWDLMDMVFFLSESSQVSLGIARYHYLNLGCFCILFIQRGYILNNILQGSFFEFNLKKNIHSR